MDFAFSLRRLETLSVEEFLKLDGDSGYLIGRNLIVCDECRSYVFLKKGDKVKPHFAHPPIHKETSKKCELRVGNYSKEYVRDLRERQSKLRVGYFQQRFEDLVYSSILDLIESKEYFLISNIYEGNKLSGIKCSPISKENKIEYLDYLRDINKSLKTSVSNNTTGISESMELLRDYFSNRLEYYKNNNKVFKKLFEESIFVEDDSKEVGDLIKNVQPDSPVDTNLKFAYELIRHLTSRGSTPLIDCLINSSANIFLSTEGSNIFKDYAENKKGLKYNEFLIDFSTFRKIILSENIPPSSRWPMLMLITQLAVYQRKIYPRNLIKLRDEFLNSSTLRPGSTKSISNMSDHWYGESPDSYLALVYELNLFKLFSMTDIASIARRNYGDNRNTPDEILETSTNKNRGFIYLAWAPYAKKMWESELLQKSMKDAVKIGRSDAPPRRKQEIEGQYAPHDSLQLVDYHPVIDMKEAENYVHKKLSKYRLSTKEVFGLDKEKAKELLEKLINQYNRQPSHQRKSKKGFG